MLSWLRRAVLAGLLLAAYLFAWTPARTAWTQTAAVVLDAVASTDAELSPRPAAHVIRLQSDTGPAFSYTAPAGVKFLLPGLFLVVLAPARPVLGVFFGGHLALGGLTILLAAMGLLGLPGGLALADFVQAYGVDTYGLAVPVLAIARRKRSR